MKRPDPPKAENEGAAPAPEAERKAPLVKRVEALAKQLAAKGNPGKGRKPTKQEIDEMWGND